MTLPKRFAHEKTSFINVSGTTVPVTSFPQFIVEEFEVLDKMKSKAAEMAFDLEMLALAIKQKTSDITSLVGEHYRKKEAEVNAAQAETK